MSAIVATTISTSLPNNPSHRNSSPMDVKKAGLESEDSRAPSSDVKDSKPDVESQTSLAPPPRPAITSATDTPDYFNSVHNPFSLEPNPFEQSFSGGGSGETPGKSILPPVAALTSPALPGTTSAGGGYGWSNSLRSGPLSPAMLAGPTGPNDYFDSIGRGFPTPNESSLRTGLTPGGGGSMFPAPSPNSQALLQQLQSGGATPSTIEFHRTALNAKKNSLNGPTSNPAVESDPSSQTSTMDMKPNPPPGADPFGHHDAADAANGLFMLAKGGQGNPNQFPVANQTSIQPQNIQSTEQPLNAAADRRNSQNINGLAQGGRSSSDASDMQGEQTKPAAKGKAKKATAAKTGAATNNRRKAEDTPKGANKKAKTSISGSTEPPSDVPDSEEDEDDMKKKGTTDTKKMTDEEKRKNFLERNRVAALKCRQRKKQWLANLQAKVELFTSENDALTATVTQLREEIVNLKTLLLAHKDCPVSQAQGLGPLMMNGMATGFDAHPYNIPSQMGMQGPPIPAQGLRR
ncbi:bZIP transcription factor atfA [Aspergillus saccharolyticus JOP 1030-1]|uniref:Basic leucine zipper (bZIP) transcription factor atfB n=1 Tax=Aspergillus saccharolyticus JOP 1030-1 TaxID=1450539 RepID=A0A318Z6W0_9EURO|nr:bZIP transcription factor AtfA [Aspergillus saccharolyticus JOP 1030-1]PYH40443.1 bZIP transcription factor AtfA [Aspergillus saccharolyticus JOP 1030-1]